MENIEELYNIIPNSRRITKDDIRKITDIKLIEDYIIYTYPNVIYNYNNIMKFLKLCENIYNDIPNNTTVIAPGDSPSRVINTIQLLYHKHDNLYIGDKYLHIINFPLSRSFRPYSPKLIDEYLSSLLIPSENIIYLDYINIGQTHELIQDSLRRLYNNSKLSLPKINIGDYLKQDSFFNYMISCAESIHSRCLPIYKLECHKISINQFRSNVLLLYIYLSAIGLINFNRSITTIFDKLTIGIMDLTYYDIEHNKFITNLCYLSSFDKNKCNILFPNGKESSILTSTIVKIENIRHPSNIPSSYSLQNHNLVTITLINNDILIGYYDGIRLDIGDGNYARYYNPFIININPTNLYTSYSLDHIKINNLYSVNYYNNGVLTTNNFYIIDYYDNNLQYIKESDFIRERKELQTCWMNKYLIHNMHLIKNKKLPSSSFNISGYGLLHYFNPLTNTIDERYDYWINNHDFIETNDYTLSIINPLIVSFIPS